MSTSRAMSAIPPEELPILESLINIRVRLTALKKKSEHIRPADVQDIYKAVIKQVSKLNAVRDERNSNTASTSSSSSTSSNTGNPASAGSSASPPQHSPAQLPAQIDGASSSRQEATPPPPKQNHNADAEVSAALTSSNRVDTTLNDVFALLSLFFLTIGRGREAPATFSQLGCMHQLLDHLAESGIYTEADLKPFATRLSELRAIITRDTQGGTKHPSQLTKLMMRQLEGCEKVLSSLQGTLSVLSAELLPLHNRLVSIRRQLSAAAAKPKPQRAEIKQLQEELRKIDNKRVDGKFLGPGGSSVPAGQAIVVGLLEESFEICHDVMVRNRNDEVPGNLQPIYERLLDIKGQLENLVLTHRWTLRETDLWNYQISLKEIDRMRVNGKFVDSEGKTPEGQLVLLYLLRRCYGLIYRLIASSEPISEELLPISNKLSTVSKCLREISKFSGTFTVRDLYPYKLALHQIDNLRQKVTVKDQEGREVEVRKWLGRDGSIPEGQGILKAQYEEVEQTIEEMLGREEEEDSDDDEDDDEEEGEEAAWDGSAASADLSSTSELSSSEEDDDDTASVTNSAISGAAWGTPNLPARDEAAVRSVAAWNARQATVKPGAPGELGAAAPPPASPAQVAVANPFAAQQASLGANSVDNNLAPLSLNSLPGRTSPTSSGFQSQPLLSPAQALTSSGSTPTTPDTATTAKFSTVQARHGLSQDEELSTPTASRNADANGQSSASRTITPGLMRASSRSAKSRPTVLQVGESAAAAPEVGSASAGAGALHSTASSPIPPTSRASQSQSASNGSSDLPNAEPAPAPAQQTPPSTANPPPEVSAAPSTAVTDGSSFAYAHAAVEPLSTRLARGSADLERPGPMERSG